MWLCHVLTVSFPFYTLLTYYFPLFLVFLQMHFPENMAIVPSESLLFLTLHCTSDFRYSHKTNRIFVLKNRDQQKHKYQQWEQKYHQKAKLPLNALGMRNNTLNEKENSYCLTTL